MKRRQFLHHLAIGGLLVSIPFSLPFNLGYKRRLNIIGLGNGGCRSVIHLWNQGIIANYTVVCEETQLSIPSSFRRIVFNPPSNTNHDDFPSLHRSVHYSDRKPVPNAVLKEFRMEDSHILVAGLGGYIGTYFLEELSLYLHENGFDFISVAGIPFEFEGRQRRTRAMSALSNLSGLRNVFSFELDEIRHKYGEMSMTQAFEKADDCSYRFISAINQGIPFGGQLDALHFRSIL